MGDHKESAVEPSNSDEVDEKCCLDALNRSTYRKQHGLRLVMQVVSLGSCCSMQHAVGMAPRTQRYNRQLAHSKRREPVGKGPEGGRVLCARLNQATAEPAVHDLIIVLQYSGILQAECASVGSQNL